MKITLLYVFDLLLNKSKNKIPTPIANNPPLEPDINIDNIIGTNISMYNIFFLPSPSKTLFKENRTGKIKVEQ